MKERSPQLPAPPGGWQRKARLCLAGRSSRGMLLIPGHLNHCWKCCKDLLERANNKLPPLLPVQGSSRSGVAPPSRVSSSNPRQHPLISAAEGMASPSGLFLLSWGLCGAPRGAGKSSSQDAPGHAVADLCCCRPSYGIPTPFGTR